MSFVIAETMRVFNHDLNRRFLLEFWASYLVCSIFFRYWLFSHFDCGWQMQMVQEWMTAWVAIGAAVTLDKQEKWGRYVLVALGGGEISLALCVYISDLPWLIWAVFLGAGLAFGALAPRFKFRMLLGCLASYSVYFLFFQVF